ncbi:rhodanese-related sulfurtransferase [Palleronia aestuarii]|uniref:Rhodanese-related sulfurtransferase n=1 Tax=Palleronia aestuarii TaxID=568105 RepID=A0A2W7NER7_9RHOB|nr:rhodanese-like domain-containing protein [Palleronia aestuarii]PZX09802.1 rhodanese-related sulfurtransferase [Palleronia aestuarii]
MRMLSVSLLALAIGTPVLAETSPENIEGATTVSAEEAAVLFDEGVVFVDVRKTSDYEAGRIPTSAHLDVKTAFTEESLSEVVAKTEPVVIYCNGEECMRSSQASEMAVSWGWEQVNYLREGFPAWEAAGLPVE